MTTVKTTIGKLPVDKGAWSASYNGGNGYARRNRVTIFNSVVESLEDNNTTTPATENNGTITFNTAKWKVIYDGSGLAAKSSLTTKADLVDGVIPESQLPSYVDDVIELLAVSDTAPATCAKGDLYYNTSTKKIVRATAANTWGTGATTNTDPESGKIYINLTDSKTYRWGGSSSGLVVISETLALGETSGTAYRGDRGKTAYDHSQSTHARTDATKTESSSTNGNIKINDSETTVYTHPTSTAATAAAVKVGNDANGHVVIGNALTAGDVNAVSYANSTQGLTNTQKSNARTNIGAGTYSKPTNGIPASDLADNAKEHEYVDLGLPSGTLWATMNVGATSETDYGNYYMYGMGAKTYDSSDTPYQGTENPLPEEYDTAAQVWGDGWRMPTNAQVYELKVNTTCQWVENYNNSGINGGLVTGSNGNSIFLPAAGNYYKGSFNVDSYYWTASPEGSNASNLYGIRSDVWTSDYALRIVGLPVRPVHDPFPVSPAKVKDSLGINSSTGSTTKYLNEQGSFTTIASDSSKQNKITASGLLKGNGSGTVSAAEAGTDYQAPLVFNTAYNASSNKVATMSDVMIQKDVTNEGTNLNINNLITPGSYRLGASHSGTFPAGLSANYSQMLVLFGGGDTYAQLYFPYSTSDVYLRTGAGYISTGINWNSWVKLSSSSDLSSYLPLSGGTMSGTLNMGLQSISFGNDARGHAGMTFNNGLSIDSDDGVHFTTAVIVDYSVQAPQFKQTYTHPTAATSYTISPNVEYFLDTITANTTFTLGNPDGSVVNEYKFQFDMGATARTISGLSASIIWQGGVPSFEANKHYEISIKAVPSAWSNGTPSSYRYFGLCSSFDLS